MIMLSFSNMLYQIYWQPARATVTESRKKLSPPPPPSINSELSDIVIIHNTKKVGSCQADV